MGKNESSNADLGLGLSQFVTSHVQDEGSPAPETPETPEPETKQAADAEKAKGDEAEKAKEPVKDEAKPKKEEKDEGKEKPKPEGKKEKEAKEEKPDKEKVEAKDKGKEKEQPKEPVVDWEKRFKDTEKWGQEQSRLRADAEKRAQAAEQKLIAEIAKLHKKLDGEWTEEDAKKEQEALKAPPEVAGFQAEVRANARASKLVAVEKYGAEQVDKYLAEFKEIFGDDPFVQQRVLSSELPVIEAINAVRGYTFFKKYGNDPDEIEKKIRESLEAELHEKIRAEEAERVADSLKQKDDLPKGLTKARGNESPAPKKGATITPLKEMFAL